MSFLSHEERLTSFKFCLVGVQLSEPSYVLVLEVIFCSVQGRNHMTQQCFY